MEVPLASVAVLDGHAHAPGQPWQHGKQSVRTLWGELAWQLGGEEAFALVKDADATGTSPGKDVLRTLLEAYAPCVVLIDELVAYIRQFQDGQPLSGGSFDSNLSFVQALTEACKLVPNAILLASLPESEVEAGSQRGVAALRALEKTFGRVQALWKPVATEEAFEIVRRRLFEPVRDEQAREAVCRAFADAYLAEGAKLPGETQEARYLDRLLQAYPIHPEVFDRLYEDWTTIEGFQRTRGVLKLMAKVIYRLWKDDNKDLMILPGSLPLYDSGSRNELTYYLPGGWDAVLEKERPEAVLVLGDTNSCLAVIPAKRRQIPVFHMEAGNRCFDMRVPEEINRRIVDHVSDINLCYTEHGRRYLLAEGLPPDRVMKTGSPMKEVLDYHRAAIDAANVHQRLGIKRGRYFTVSIHREENVDNPIHLASLVEALNALAGKYRLPLVFSVHPRTRKRLEAGRHKLHKLIQAMPPLGFFDYVALQKDAFCTLSDSGTITEESSILGFPAIAVREAHERPEGMDEGVVIMSGLARSRILQAVAMTVAQFKKRGSCGLPPDYDVEQVSWKVAKIILSYTDYVNRRVWQKF